MKVVLGVFDSVASARGCERELQRAGFDDVHLIESENTLLTHGLPREALHRHRDDLRRGGCLLVARCDAADEPAVRRIIEASQGLGGEEGIGHASMKVPLAEEEVRVGKVVEEKGGVRLHTYTEERPVEANVNLREEHVDVERRRVDRPPGPDDEALFRDRTIQVDESAEVPVVEKRTRITEEVEVRKDVEVKPTTVRETVRKQKATIDEDIRPMREDPIDRFGYDLAGDPAYRDRDWTLIEPEARARWANQHDGSRWEALKDRIRNAFESRRSEMRRSPPP